MPSLKKIVSGGQTGADRAALDFAVENGTPHGGWCPRGRPAEDGAIPPRYALSETPSEKYEQRTEWNVRDSDATAIFSEDRPLSGGTLHTFETAEKWGKPCLVLHRSDADPAERLREFIKTHGVQVLNVAGPRASKAPAIAAFVRETLAAVLSA